MLTSFEGQARQDGRMNNEAQLVEIYESVRNLPYDTAAAHDAASFVTRGGGTAIKADLLAEELKRCRR